MLRFLTFWASAAGTLVPPGQQRHSVGHCCGLLVSAGMFFLIAAWGSPQTQVRCDPLWPKPAPGFQGISRPRTRLHPGGSGEGNIIGGQLQCSSVCIQVYSRVELIFLLLPDVLQAATAMKFLPKWAFPFLWNFKCSCRNSACELI